MTIENKYNHIAHYLICLPYFIPFPSHSSLKHIINAADNNSESCLMYNEEGWISLLSSCQKAIHMLLVLNLLPLLWPSYYFKRTSKRFWHCKNDGAVLSMKNMIALIIFNYQIECSILMFGLFLFKLKSCCIKFLISQWATPLYHIDFSLYSIIRPDDRIVL